MPISIQKASEIKLGDNFILKVLGYGRTGVGKTRIIRSLPKPSFVVDTDGGELTNRGVDGIEYVTIPPTISKTLDGWNAYIEAKNLFIGKHIVKYYRSAVIDGITTLADAAMARILKINNHDQATLPDYNQEKEMVQSEIMWWMSQGVHIYIIAHEEIIRNELTGQIWSLPAARGQLQAKLPIWFDEVYHFRAKKGASQVLEYKMLVKADVTYSCKSRLGSDPKIDAEQEQDFIAYAKKCGVDLK